MHSSDFSGHLEAELNSSPSLSEPRARALSATPGCSGGTRPLPTPSAQHRAAQTGQGASATASECPAQMPCFLAAPRGWRTEAAPIERRTRGQCERRTQALASGETGFR